MPRKVVEPRQPSDVCQLSNKDMEVITWLSLGFTTVEIGQIMGIKRDSVLRRMIIMRNKLGVKTTYQMMVKITKDGLVKEVN